MPAAPDITVQVIGVKGCELKGKGSVQVVVNNMTGITRVSEGSELSFNQTFAFKRAEIIRLLVFNREGTVCYYVDAKLDKVLNSGTCWLPLTGEVSGGQIGIVVSTIKGDISAPAAIPTSSSNNVSFSLPKTDSQSIPLPPESHTNTIHTPSLESHSSKPTTPNSRPTQPQQSPPHIDLPPPITHQTNVSTVSSVPLPTSTSPSSPRPSPRPSVPTTTTTTTTTTTVVESPIATNLLPTDNSTLTLYTTSLRYNLQEYNACNRLKHILTAKNVPFVDIDVANEGNRSRWDQAKHSAQSKSIPLIFVGPKFVSTFDNFEQWNEEGTLYKHLTELGYTGPSPSSHENNAMASSSYSLAVPSIPAIQDPRFRTYQEYGFEPNSPPSQYMTSPTYNYVQPSSPQSMTRIAMPMPMEYPSPYHQLSPPSRFYPESPPLIPSSSSPRPISRSDAVPYSTPNLAAMDYSYPAVSTPYASTYELASPMADPSQTCRPVQHMGISSYQHNNLPEPHVYDSLVWVTALARGDWFYIWNSERTMKKAYWVWVESQRGLLCWSGSDLATNIEDPSHAVIWMPLQECFNVLSAPTVDGSGEVNYNTLVVFSSYHLLLTTSKHLKFALWFYGLCQLTERARRSNANLDAYLSSADPAISWADWRGGPHMIR